VKAHFIPVYYLVSAAAIAPVLAQAADTSTSLDSMIVIGKQTTFNNSDLAGAVDAIGRDELEYEHVDDTMELFSKVPGVSFSRYNQGVINTDISIRGFAGDGSSPHAKLLIDGIPSNLHNGYSELDQLFPLGIDSVEIFKGTSDARYGLHNVAGNYSVSSRSDTDDNELEVTLGSFNTREVQGYYGAKQGKLTHNYFLGYRENEGFRDHTDLEKYTASGRWFYDVSDSTSIGFIARVSRYKGDAPGYLSKEDRRKRTSAASFADQDGGDKKIRHFSVHLNTALSESVDWSLKVYQQTFERERWVRFSELNTLQNRYDDQDHSGIISVLHWQLNDDWRLRWGADLEFQDVVEQRFGTLGQSRRRDSANVIRDRHYDFDTTGTYIKIDHELNSLFRWNAAIRVDRLDGDFDQFDALGNVESRDIYDFGSIVQPKVNLFLSPRSDVTLFANYGRSFQHPFGASAYAPAGTDTGAQDVSINDGWEIGGRWMVSENIELRLSHWQQKAKDELVNTDTGQENVGKTERKGFDLGLNWSVTERLYVWGNYSTTDSKIVNPDSSDAANIGNELRSIADFTASVGANYDITSALVARVHVDAQGDYYVNEENSGGKFGDYTLVHVGLDYETSWGGVNVQVNNLFDEFYEYVFDLNGDGTGTIHSPGDGINASVSLSYKF